MLVYGDHIRSVAPSRMIDDIRSLVGMAAAELPGVRRHDLLVSALIEAGALAQGIGDAVSIATGCDRDAPNTRAAMALVMALARQVGASWDSGFSTAVEEPEAALVGLTAGPLPAEIVVKQPEGYAFYALYPETYFRAALGLPAGVVVIGLRSIGTSLAAMVAVGARADRAPIILRPVGHPFRRRIAIDAELRADMRRDRAERHAIVDEGPGLSGSSFGAVADLLENLGVEPCNVTIFPGHSGDPGSEADARHVRRWRRSDRRVATFEAMILPRMVAAAEEVTGPATGPIEDLSGGRWRTFSFDHEADWPPVHAMQERRKFLLRTASGPWLLKFAGLGRFGDAAVAAQRDFAAAGFGPKPVALRLGFTIQRWETGARPPQAIDRPMLLDVLGRCLAFRARRPAGPGASLERLAEMTVRNIGEALGGEAASAWGRRHGRLDRLPSPVPVRTDNRLHAWEWIRTTDGRVLKTDASDHGRAHDLIGCQDIAWDIVGAAVELDLSETEIDALIAAIEVGSAKIRKPLLTWLAPAYLAFQIGAWTLAAHQAAGEEKGRIDALLARYTGKIERLLVA